MPDYSNAKRYRVVFKDGGNITVTARTEAEARKVAIRMVKDHKKYTGGHASTDVKNVEKDS